MSLSFSTSVSINNLLALKAFHTFLFNYGLHEKPGVIERMAIPHLQSWVERKAMSTINELLRDEDAKLASVSLNDVSAGIFTCLYLVQNQHLLTEVKTGKDLFMLMAEMELEFVKVQRPKATTEYKPNV